MAHPGGRPRAFETPDEMERLINKYFENDKIPLKTMCGLALALGFCDRQSLYDYEKISEFSCTIKRAMLQLEDAYEHRVNTMQPTGPIFVLKNMGWRDKQEIDQTNHYPDKIKIDFKKDDNSDL